MSDYDYEKHIGDDVAVTIDIPRPDRPELKQNFFGKITETTDDFITLRLARSTGHVLIKKDTILAVRFR